MHSIDFWFDPISPYAYLAFEQLPEALAGHSYNVTYRPVLFAGLLGHWGQKGPAEIAPKRAWTYRDVLWLAKSAGIPLALPAQHPFNPLPLLRLALACAPAGGQPNRRVAEAVMRQAWRGDGADANDAQRLAALSAELAPQRNPQGDEVKAELKQATADAAALGVFGVPTFAHAGRLYWGVSALPMLAAALAGDGWFDSEWDAVAAARPGVQR